MARGTPRTPADRSRCRRASGTQSAHAGALHSLCCSLFRSRFGSLLCDWFGAILMHRQKAVRGWVSRRAYPDASTLGTKYMDSMYSVFTAEYAFTSSEKGVGVLGELVVGFIYGSLAGVISSIMVTMGVGQQDSMLKLLSLKAWMKARNLKKSDKVKILAAFNNANEGAPFNEKLVSTNTI